MQMVVMIMIVLAIAATLDTRTTDRDAELRDKATAIAQQLAWHHGAAERACAVECPAGEVEVAIVPGGRVVAGYYISRSDGDAVVTSLRPGGVDLSRPAVGLTGLVSAALLRTTTSLRSGTYRAADGTVRRGTPLGGVAHEPRVTVPEGLRDGLEDGAPVLLTCLRGPDGCVQPGP